MRKWKKFVPPFWENSQLFFFWMNPSLIATSKHFSLVITVFLFQHGLCYYVHASEAREWFTLLAHWVVMWLLSPIVLERINGFWEVWKKSTLFSIIFIFLLKASLGKYLGIQAVNENENVPKSRDANLMNGGDYGCLEVVYIVLGYWWL